MITASHRIQQNQLSVHLATCSLVFLKFAILYCHRSSRPRTSHHRRRRSNHLLPCVFSNRIGCLTTTASGHFGKLITDHCMQDEYHQENKIVAGQHRRFCRLRPPS